MEYRDISKVIFKIIFGLYFSVFLCFPFVFLGYLGTSGLWRTYKALIRPLRAIKEPYAAITCLIVPKSPHPFWYNKSCLAMAP